MNGVHLEGWGSHDLNVRGSWPPKLWKQLRKNFGPPIMVPEVYQPQSAKTLLKLRDQMLHATEQTLLISQFLLDQGPWDLFFVAFGATHRAGHLLWDLSQIETTGCAPETVHALNNALVDVYQGCDRAIAHLIENAPPDAKILVFSVHGMGPNPGWLEYVPELLSRIQQIDEHTSPRPGILFKVVKQHLPWQLIRGLTDHLPSTMLNWLVSVYSANMFDWKNTRYFPVPMPCLGFVRVNLKGREPQGIVEPGEEYLRVCEELRTALQSFCDIETGKAIVEEVCLLDDWVPLDAPYRDRLPDLFIKWGEVTASQSKGIRSEKYGDIYWNTGGKLPSRRSGNHLDKGWFVAVGDRIPSGIQSDGHRTVDLVPTIFHWLGTEPPEDFQGKPITALCGDPIVQAKSLA